MQIDEQVNFGTAQIPHYRTSGNYGLIIDPQLPAPSRPDSVTGGALQRHRRGQGSNPRSGMTFSGFSRCCLSNAKI